MLETDTFAFNDKHYMRIKGTAMVTKCALGYVTLVLSYLEKMLNEKSAITLVITSVSSLLTPDLTVLDMTEILVMPRI